MSRQTSQEIRELLRLAEPVDLAVLRTGEPWESDGVLRSRLEYRGLEGDLIPALLFEPVGQPCRGGVVAFHQHAGQFHLGKSEIAGDAGDPLQAFGPELARCGIAVLAPDALTFEERRLGTNGIEVGEDDWSQHYNALAYRLLNGDTLMRKCLDDAQRALSALLNAVELERMAVGVMGHSYGGLTALYHAAVDHRVQFSCVSGALCSFENRRRHGTSINMFEVVPGLAVRWETKDILSAIPPRPSLVVSATEDVYSRDADKVVSEVASNSVEQIRVSGGHS